MPEALVSHAEAALRHGAFPAPPFAWRCLEAAGGALGASFDHPFMRALAGGSLDPALFRFYQMQDARYLDAFADVADASARDRSVSAFRASCRYEWMFWEQAWPV